MVKKSGVLLLPWIVAGFLVLLLFNWLPVQANSPVYAVDASQLEGVTITYWHHHTSDREVYLNELVTEFNETNSYQITVVPEYRGSYYNIYTQVISGLINDGELPNVVVSYPNQFAQFARYGKVHFLDEYINDQTYGITDQADFYPGILDYYKLPDFGDQVAGLQWVRSIELMYYNQDLLSQKSLSVPQTWDEFINACKETSSEDVLGTMFSIDASRFATWLWSHGGELFSSDFETVRFAEQPGIDTLMVFQELIQGGYADIVNESYEDQTLFGQGKVVFTFGTSTSIPYYREVMENGVNQAWGVTRSPAIDGYEVVDSYGAGQGIITHSPEEDLASWLFIKWLTEKEQTARFAAFTSYFPVRLSATSHISMTEALNNDPVYAQAFELLPYGKPEPAIRGYDQIRIILGNVMADTLANNAEITTTLQAAADQALAIIQNSGESAVITPELGGTVVFTNTFGITATLQFPPEAVDEAVMVSLLLVDDLPTNGLGFTIVPDLELSTPVTLTIEYTDDDIIGMDESSLVLYNYDWATQLWKDADPCGGYVRLPEENTLKAVVCHFSDYAMMNLLKWIHLPMIIR